MYKLERKSYDKVEYVKLFKEFFPGTVWHAQSFAVCLAGGAGICLGMFNMDSSIIQDIKFIPAIFLVGSAYYAREVYKNFKAERERLHELAEQRKIEDERRANNKTIELQKQGFITPIQISDFEIQKSIDSDDKIVDLQTYRDILTNAQEESIGMNNGKRLSLNNGIFKPEN